MFRHSSVILGLVLILTDSYAEPQSDTHAEHPVHSSLFNHRLDSPFKPLMTHEEVRKLPSQAGEFFDQYVFYLRQLNYSSALKTAETAINTMPGLRLFHALKVNGLIELYRLKEARAALSALRQQSPDDKQVYHLLLKILVAQGKLSEALTIIDEAHQSFAGEFQALRAWIFLQIADPFKARNEIEKVMTGSDENQYFALSVLLEACQQLGDKICTQRAERRFALIKPPQLDEPSEQAKRAKYAGTHQRQPADYLRIIQTKAEAREINEAIGLSNDLINAFPEHALGYRVKVNLTLSDGYLDVAYDTLETFIQRVPEFTLALQLKAQLFVMQGQNTAALQIYQSLMQLVPDHILPVHEYGELLIQTGQFENAVTFYKAHIQRFPNAYWLRLRLAKAYRGQALFGQAERAYQQAIDLYPKRVIAYNGLASTKQMQRKFNQAVEIYRQSLAITESNFEALSGLASIHLFNNNLQRAEKYARQSIAAYPANPLPYSTLANVLFQQGRIEEAGQACADVKKRLAKAYDFYTLNECYFYIQQYDQALALAQEIYRSQATPSATANLLNAYFKKGHWKKVIEIFEKHRLGLPNDLYVLDNYAKSLAHNDRHRDALTVFKQMLKVRPDDAATLVQSGFQHYLLEQHGQAIEAYMKAYKLEPENIASLQLIAQTYQQAGQFSKADKWYEEYLKAAPDNQNVVTDYADYLYQRKKYAQAITYADKQLAVFPDDGTLLRVMMLSYTVAGNEVEVLGFFNRLMATGQVAARDYHTLGLLYARQKQRDKALQLFEKAVALAPDVSHYYNEVGYGYFVKKNYAKALSAYQKGLALPGGEQNGLLNYNYATALYSTGQFKQAKQALLNAQNAGYSGNPKFTDVLDRTLEQTIQ